MFLMIDYVIGGSRSVPIEFTLKEFCFDDTGEDLFRSIWDKDKMEISGMRVCDNLGRNLKTYVKGGFWVG